MSTFRTEIEVELDRLYVRARKLDPDAMHDLAERMFRHAMELGARAQEMKDEEVLVGP